MFLFSTIKKDRNEDYSLIIQNEFLLNLCAILNYFLNLSKFDFQDYCKTIFSVVTANLPFHIFHEVLRNI